MLYTYSVFPALVEVGFLFSVALASSSFSRFCGFPIEASKKTVLIAQIKFPMTSINAISFTARLSGIPKQHGPILFIP